MTTEAGHGAVHAGAREMWVAGLEGFAAVMMILIGLFHIIEGLAAILRGSYYVVTPNYVFEFSVTGWAWVHLIVGILVGITGLVLFTGKPWARIAGLIIVSLSAIANFLFIPYQTAWSLLIIALDVAVIWALAVHLRELRSRGSESTT